MKRPADAGRLEKPSRAPSGAGNDALSRPDGAQRAVIVGLAIGHKRDGAGLDELAALATSAGATVVGRVTGRRAAPDPALYAGRGKVDE
ncbi:MAG TPA: hypothetical protein VF059_07645, partial [Casimicrobiaceae bacterium]